MQGTCQKVQNIFRFVEMLVAASCRCVLKKNVSTHEEWVKEIRFGWYLWVATRNLDPYRWYQNKRTKCKYASMNTVGSLSNSSTSSIFGHARFVRFL